MKTYSNRISPPRSLAIALVAFAIAGCADTTDSEPSEAEALGSTEEGLTCVTLFRPGAATADARITSNPLDPSAAVSNFGASNLLLVGTTGPATSQSLVSFDLSSIPANVPVASATLRLTKAAGLGPGPILVHTATAAWSESTVTAASFGGAFSPAIVATLDPTTVPPNGTAFLDVTSAVSQWNAGTAANYGFLLEEPTGGRTQLAASEAQPARRPALTVCYQAPTCSDGLQNQGETGVDCGGPCAACPGNPCTGVVCAPIDACHLAGTCNPGTGLCSAPPAPSGAGCDDGNACTQGDSCDGAGACLSGAPVVCAAPGACQSGGSCDPQSGQCSYVPLADGTPCVDGDVCNGDESCQGGQCAAGTPLQCGDAYSCTTESCDAVLGCTSSGGPTGAPWATGEVSTDYGGGISDIATDAAGYTYVVGRFVGNLDLGSGVTLISDVIPDPYDYYFTSDCYVAKYDPSGTPLWAVNIPDYGVDSTGGGVAVDGNAVYATFNSSYNDWGWMWSWAGLARLDATTGALAWSTYLASDNATNVGDVAVTSTGLPVAVADSHMFDPWSYWYGPATGTVGAFDPLTGTLVWSASLPSGNDVRLSAVTTDGLGNTFVAGSFDTTLQTGSTTLTATGARDLAVAKLDASGAVQWSLAVGDAGATQSMAGLVADAGGAVYLGATVSGSVSVAGGPALAPLGGTDVLLAKLDASGAHVWSKVLGGPNDEGSGRLVLDAAGILTSSGGYELGADFGGGPLATDYATSYLVQLDSAGGFVAQRDMRFVGISGLGVDCAGGLYIGGTSGTDADFGFGSLSKKAFAVIALNDMPATHGPGSCSGGSYCDALQCYAPTAAESVLHCACGNLDPTCGIGSCGGGAYCEGGGCASPQCFGPGSPEARAMCGGGTASAATCTVTGGTKRVFVTSTLHNGNMGGVAGADAICQARANAAGLGGTFQAFLGAAGQSPQDRVAHFDGPYVRTDGTFVANNWIGMSTGNLPLLAPINKTETGGAPPIGTINWLGQSAAWTGWDLNTCADWTSTAAPGGSSWGAVNQTTSIWYYGVMGGVCSYTAPLYCFEQ